MFLLIILFFISLFSKFEGEITSSSGMHCQTPNIQNGLTIINQTNKEYLQGSSISYACTVGRLIPPNAKQYCVNGSWTGIQPKCAKAKCPLFQITNDKWKIILSSNSNRNFMEEGSTAKLQCLTDSTIQLRKCLYNGTWQTSNDPQFCAKLNDLVCSAPQLAHGSFTCLTAGCDRFKGGVEIVFQCSTGYRLLGQYKSKCRLGADKQIAYWENIPECVPISDDGNNADSNHDINDNAGIERFTILVVISASLLGALLVIIACVLVCRFTLCRKVFRPINAPTRESPRDLPVRDVGARTEDAHIQCYSVDNNVNTDANDDRAALINPPSYEEAMQSAGPFHTCGGRSNRLYNDAACEDDDISSNSCHAIGSQNSALDSVVSRSQSRQGLPFGVVMMDGSGSALPPSETVRANQQARANARQRERRNQELDSVSRHSTQTSVSHGAALSGSVETMAISDGTSVTLRTFESLGSNPSLGSTRPQTGSLGEPAGSSTCSQSTNQCIYDGRQAPVINSCISQRNGEPIKEPDSISVRS